MKELKTPILDELLSIIPNSMAPWEAVAGMLYQRPLVDMYALADEIKALKEAADAGAPILEMRKKLEALDGSYTMALQEPPRVFHGPDGTYSAPPDRLKELEEQADQNSLDIAILSKALQRAGIKL